MIELILIAAVTGAPAATNDPRVELAAKLPGIEAKDLRESPIPGLYEVLVGARIVYVSADGRYLLNGQMIDLETETSVTENRLSEIRSEWAAGLDESRMIIFEPKGATRHTVTVFTDIDCGFCRTMHADIDGLLAAGVRVRYLLYPRSGPGTESAKKADHVWCSADRNDALTRAKAGKRVTAPACETPVEANFELGRTMSVTGTPTIITDSGGLVPGYLETEKLVAELDRFKASKSPRAADSR
jgi:thiol:disulfide interchange protein DsbC